ncbi:MAG: FHA domain-containing protein [Dokdonella sp.]
MSARFNAYVPDSAAVVQLLDDAKVYRIGRAAHCDLVIDHASVSRQHAELSSSGGAWSIQDSGSKNGLRVDGRRIESASFSTDTWFSIGEIYCWLELLDDEALAQWRDHVTQRRASLRRLSTRLPPHLDVNSLLPRALDGVLELSGFERGFVLYASDGDAFRVCATRGMQTSDLKNSTFDGSATSVDEAVRTRKSVICCDTDITPWLGSRPSVRLGGIRAVVCVPMLDGHNVIGVVYADSRLPGPPMTTFDLELIESAADQAATALAARRIQDEVDGLLRSAADAGLNAPRWEDLRG